MIRIKLICNILAPQIRNILAPRIRNILVSQIRNILAPQIRKICLIYVAQCDNTSETLNKRTF